MPVENLENHATPSLSLGVHTLSGVFQWASVYPSDLAKLSIRRAKVEKRSRTKPGVKHTGRWPITAFMIFEKPKPVMKQKVSFIFFVFKKVRTMPSLHWLRTHLSECNCLHRRLSPRAFSITCLAFGGISTPPVSLHGPRPIFTILARIAVPTLNRSQPLMACFVDAQSCKPGSDDPHAEPHQGSGRQLTRSNGSYHTVGWPGDFISSGE